MSADDNASISSVTSMREARRSRARRAQAVESGPALSTFVGSRQLSLESAAKSPKTVRSYLDSLRALIKFLGTQGVPTDTEGVDAAHIQAFLLARDRTHVGRVRRYPLPEPARVLRLARGRRGAFQPHPHGPRRGSQGSLKRFEREVDPDGKLPPDERARRGRPHGDARRRSSSL